MTTPSSESGHTKGPPDLIEPRIVPDASAISARATAIAWRQHLLPTLMLIALSLALWIGPLGIRWLHSPDEGRYAEIARELLASGDWVTPRLNGILYFEKPPLVYWATALFLEHFGVNAFAARLWPAFTALLPMPFLWWVTRRSFGNGVATASVAILASSFWWVTNGHFLNLDMSLSAFMTIGLLMAWAANLPGTTDRQAINRMRVGWIALALAVLSKGIVAVVILGLGTALYLLATRDWRLWRRLSLFEGSLIMLTLCGPWFLLMEIRNPGFLEFFFIHEHFQRFTTLAHRRTGPWYYFLPILALGAFPWTSHLLATARIGWRSRADDFQVERYLAIQALTVFFFFSASGSKLSSYILPMFPPLAVLIAVSLQSIQAARIGRHLMVSAVILALLGIVATIILERPMPGVSTNGLSGFVAATLSGLALLAGAGLWLMRRASHWSSTRAILLAAVAALACSQLTLSGYQLLEAQRSPVRWLAQAEPYLNSDTPFYSVGTYDQSIPFYLKRPITLVDYVDEFAPGIQREPYRQLPTLSAFADIWRTQPGAVALMSREVHEKLQASGLPMTTIAHDSRRVLVRRP